MSTASTVSLARCAHREARWSSVVEGVGRSWGIVDCCRGWIVHLEQTHAWPNTIRAYVRHVVEFANFLSANGAGLHQATVSLYDSFLAWRLATRKDALPSPRLVLLGRQATRTLAPATRNQIQLAINHSTASSMVPTTSRSIRPRLRGPTTALAFTSRSWSISASAARHDARTVICPAILGVFSRRCSRSG